MKPKKIFQIIAVREIERAAALGCYGHYSHIAMGRKNELQYFWLNETPEAYITLRKYDKGKLNVNIKRYRDQLETLKTRIKEQKEQNIRHKLVDKD